MEFFFDQHLSIEELREQRDKTKALSNEWQGKLMASVAAANGAGLVALASFLGSKSLNPWVLGILFLAAILFIVGLALISHGIFMTHYMYEMHSRRLEADAQIKIFARDFVPHITAEQAAPFLENQPKSVEAFSQLVIDAYWRRGAAVNWSLRAFIVGLLLALGAIAANSLINAAQPAPKPVWVNLLPNASQAS